MSFPVRATRNFDANVREIERYLERHGSIAPLLRFSEDMDSRVTPLLENTPGIGALFREHDSLAPDDRFVLERIVHRLKARELRQIVGEQFVVLYLVAPRSVHLLAVRDQRQAAFRLG